MSQIETAVTRTVTESVYVTNPPSSYAADSSIFSFAPAAHLLLGSDDTTTSSSISNISSSSSSNFMYGLLAGQFSVMLVMWFFIRFFIFADPPPDKKDYQSHVRQQRQAKLLLPEVHASPSDILERTYYDVDTHAPESLDWLTVLIAQGVRHFRRARWDGSSDAATTSTTANGDVNNGRNESAIDDSEDSEAGVPAVGSDKLAVLERLLNFDKLPGFVDKIKVVELNIGKNYPAFRNCKIVKRKSQSVAAAAEAAAAVAAMTGHPIGLGDEEAVAGSDYSDNEAESLLSTPRHSLHRRRSSHYRRHPPRSAATRTLSTSSTSSPSAPDILEVQMDVELKDTITLGIETRLILNFPRPGFAFLPIKLVVSVVEFSGTLKVSLRNNKNSVPEPTTDDMTEASSSNGMDNSSHNEANATSNSPSDNEAIFDDDDTEGDYVNHPSTAASGSGDPHDGGEPDHHAEEGGASASGKAGPRNRLYDDAYITLSFAPNYTLRFDIQSSIGSLAASSRLLNVAKIAQLVEHRLKQIFEERFVYPNHRKFYLPSVLPRKNPSPPEGPGKQSSQQQQQQQPSAASQQQQQQTSSQQQQQSQQQQVPHHGFIIDDHATSPRLHPRSFSSVSQLASNTALNMPPQAPPPTLPLRGSNHHNYHHNYNQVVMDDESAII